MMHDVIIEGAGPAGATAAVSLAQKGYDVLLLDRQTFPRDKACGDGIPTGSIKIMQRRGMGPRIQQAVARGEFYPVDHIRLVSPTGYALEADFKPREGITGSYIAPRLYFDALIQQHAIDTGASFCQAQVQEPLLENGRVTGVRARHNGHTETLRAHVVIGAGGVTSAVARTLRPQSKQHVEGHRAVALRAYIEKFEALPHEIEFYLYNEILPGYAWIFPNGDHSANIGLGMRLDCFRRRDRSLKEMLRAFLEMPAIKKRLRPQTALRNMATWQLNFGSQKHLQHAFDGALLVGDAAGFINPLTGGGIDNALISAEFAAQTIHEALSTGDTSRAALQIYEKRCHEAMWGGMRLSYFLQRWLLRFPRLVDFLIRHMDVRNHFVQTFLTKL